VLSLAIYVVIGLALLALLYVVLCRRPPRAEGSAQALLTARQAVKTLNSGLLPTELVQRIFSVSDLEYVRASAPESIQRLFWRERKRIGLAWVSELREQITPLQDFHRTHSRHFAHLNPAKEIWLALEFSMLRVQCRLLYLLILWRGPYEATAAARNVAAGAGRLSEVTDGALAFLSPTSRMGVAEDAGQPDVTA
jgi:hypothetical protein